MKITRIDLNSWLFQMTGQTILVDPWLVDPLVFNGIPWLFTAYHNTPPVFTPETLPPIDLLLLSQGLDDHCHRPTLQRLDRSIPVVASPTAAKAVRELGYSQVTVLSNWQTTVVAETLQITAIPGAEIQPGQVENGYALRDRTTDETLYYEPHLTTVNERLVQEIGAVDVAIAPIIGQIFPLLGQIIMGPEQAMQFIQTVSPRWFMPTAMGDIRADGILPKLIRSVGTVAEFRDRLTASGLPTKLLLPDPGEMLDLCRLSTLN